MKPPRSYGPKTRTAADRNMDCQMHCIQARFEMVRDTTDEALATLKGVKVEVARFHRAARLARGW